MESVTHNRNIPHCRCANCRSERLLNAALQVILDHWGFDISFINQRDLRADHILRRGQLPGGAIEAFAEVLQEELGGTHDQR